MWSIGTSHSRVWRQAVQAKDEAAPHKTSTSISVRCFTFPAVVPLMVMSAREMEARRGASCFTFLDAPLMVTSVREIEAFTSHGREKGKKRRRGREAPPSSLLL